MAQTSGPGRSIRAAAAAHLGLTSWSGCGLLLVWALTALLTAAASPTPAAGRLSAEQPTTLLQVQAVFRHGARTPTSPYPNDPHKDFDYMPYGLGHLTGLGRYHEYALGRLIRSRYMDSADAPASVSRLLDAEYSAGAVRVNTSGVLRTQESAAALLAGLFPPGSEQVWPGDASLTTGLGHLWFPITYAVVPLAEDYALAGAGPCAARDDTLAALYASAAYRERLLRVVEGQDTLDYIEEHAGIDASTDPAALYLVYSALQCQELLNMTIPEWSGPVYPEPLRSAANLWLMSLSYSSLLRRQSFGDLIAWVLSAAKAHETEPKLQLFSAHDSTVTAVIQAFGLQPDDDAGFGIPDFSACVLIELHQDADGDLGFKFFYRREPGGSVVPMTPKGCDALCPLDKLESLAREDYRQPGDCIAQNQAAVAASKNHLLAHVNG